MRILQISDLHFTGKPADEHFWRLFPVVNECLIKRKIDQLFILGDLTSAKDNHCAKLVNRIVTGILGWADSVELVRILMGNHDYKASANDPYFSFMGKYPKVQYIREPLSDGELLFLPHSTDPLNVWHLENVDVEGKYVFAHVTVEGSVYETGIKANEGVSPEYFSLAKLAFSGDIHSRQSVGPMHYVGCPYQVRFNDKFQGGGILLDTDTGLWEYIDFDFPKRITLNIQSAADLAIMVEDLKAEDQLKVRLHLDQRNMGQARHIKEQVQALCSSKDLTLHAFELIKNFNDSKPASALTETERRFTSFSTFCEFNKITAELKAVGELIIAECV